MEGMDREGVLANQQAAQLLGCSPEHVVALGAGGKLGRGLPPSPAAQQESALVHSAVPGALGVGDGGAVGLAEKKPDTGSPAASGSAPVPSGGGAPEWRAAEAPDPRAAPTR